MESTNISSISTDVLNMTTPFATTTVATNMSNETTPCGPQEQSSLLYDITMLNRVVMPIIYILGFPGNALAFLVWIRPKMSHSSGVYLAALALVDFIFLIMNLLLYLNESWHINTLSHPVICESYTVIYLTFQYLAPLLVLSFTIERYISICHPFAREKYCTQRRARIVTVGLAVGSLAICAIQGYFWRYANGDCGIREHLLAGGPASFWNIWSMCTEMLIFLIMPLCVLTFNMMVIRETKRLSKYEPGQAAGRHQKTSATTIMLLAVSFYLIVTTLPVSIVYVTAPFFKMGDMCVSQETDPVWRKYYKYELVREIIEGIGLTHFALNFYIYCITGKQFRKEFLNIFQSVLNKTLPEKIRTEYTSLQSSFGDSVKRQMTVRLSANGSSVSSHKENGGETHV